MSVKVNLLPREVEERARERRVGLLSLTAVGVWVLLLALLYLQSVMAVNNARDERDAEQAELERLQAQAERLAPYRELARRYDTHNQLLASAMAPQVSWSGVLNDLALVFPANSSLLTLSASLGVPEGEVGGEVPLIGSLQFNGYSVERYAPGVESVLLALGDAPAFQALYLSSATRGLIGTTQVTNFTGSAELTERVYTGRFAQGLPEGER
ncbi:MAG TPA: hypothetical protein VNU01_02320 [Egibacteraceae bacterium]|nr:hypothetical protein [Egibacteraceae bacterium]